MLSFVIPTHNRSAELRETLDKMSELEFDPGSVEIVIVDNASQRAVSAAEGACAPPTTLVRSDTNLGAAGRNLGAHAARGRWLVMLDDDSSPTDPQGLLAALHSAPDDVAAVMADIHLSEDRGRERGGLPEVFIGCGVAIRRDAFLDAGGYDRAFGYYAEEYDLAAKLLLANHRIGFDPRFRVEHRKVERGRDMDTIVHRLVRNNGWVMQRYAPEHHRLPMLRHDRKRYREIARCEHAMTGYERGLVELRRTIRSQTRTPMSGAMFERFTGLTHGRTALGEAHAAQVFTSAAIVDRGKHAWCIEQVLDEFGVRRIEQPDQADVVIPGSMSPGPMLDSAFAWQQAGARVVCPWIPAQRMLGSREATQV